MSVCVGSGHISSHHDIKLLMMVTFFISFFVPIKPTKNRTQVQEEKQVWCFSRRYYGTPHTARLWDDNDVCVCNRTKKPR